MSVCNVSVVTRAVSLPSARCPPTSTVPDRWSCTNMADSLPSRYMCLPNCINSRLATQLKKSKEIDREILKDNGKQLVTILLLGAGESGKSTFLKQMRIIHGQDFDQRAKEEFKATIYSNVMKGVQVLVDAREKLHIPWGDPSNQVHGDTMMASDTRSTMISQSMETKVFLQFLPSIHALWADNGIQNAYDRRREFQLDESVKYFLDNLDKIGAQDYLPSQQDILLARKPTKGIHEYDFEIKNVPFKMVDVGGQRSERRRWFECFDSVTSIFFLVSSNEFDQVLMEDRQTNRLMESLNIFKTIVNNRIFYKVTTILILNKTDLLEEKVKTVAIKDYFPEYTGEPHSLEDVQKFLVESFRNHGGMVVPGYWGCFLKPEPRGLYHHFTTAIDTENIRTIFSDVKDIILYDNFRHIRLQ